MPPLLSPLGSRRDIAVTTPSSRIPVTGAADFCGCSSSLLNKLRVAGGGPRFIKLGRKVVYDTADLSAWLETRRRSSTSASLTLNQRGPG